jgi:predicted aspartyl protease
MQILVSIRASYNMADIKALVDSGATDNFIHPNFVKRMGLGQSELDKPKNIYNIDDTTNRSGQITHYLSLAVTMAGKTQEMRFLITDIGREDILLGYPWLSTYEPASAGSMARLTKAISPSYCKQSTRMTKRRSY